TGVQTCALPISEGPLAIVDYKTGAPPSGREVEAGYALQLGTLGLMAQRGAFDKAEGQPARFEYWSLGSSRTSDTGFGYVTTPILEGRSEEHTSELQSRENLV